MIFLVMIDLVAVAVIIKVARNPGCLREGVKRKIDKACMWWMDKRAKEKKDKEWKEVKR